MRTGKYINPQFFVGLGTHLVGEFTYDLHTSWNNLEPALPNLRPYSPSAFRVFG